MHAYLWWKGGDGLIRKNIDELMYGGFWPRVDVCTRTNPTRVESAAHQGLHYVSIHKLGTVASASNFKPFHDYTPQPAWIDGWWRAQKLSHAQYLGYVAQLRTGFAARKRDVEEVIRAEKEQVIDDHLEQELAKQSDQAPSKPIRDFPEVDRFVQLFGQTCKRRPILVIVGGTNLGKSELARAVLRRVAELLSLPGFLEVTVEVDTSLDLSEFDLTQHAGVLLDGVDNVMMLKTHREAMQGRVKKCRGGKSATMMYAYPFTLCRRAVVATLDLSAKNLHLLATDHWLRDPQNVVVVDLKSPSWVTDDGDVVMQPPPMSAWSVSEVAHWLESVDMEGPAMSLRAQGVNGHDLLNICDAEEFCRDLKVTPFVARKVLSLRDQCAR